MRGIGDLAQRMLARAFAAGVPVRWVVGDTVYGYDEMRGWLEEQQRNFVLAVPETHTVWIAGQPQPVGLVAALLPEEAWVPLSAGEGSQGPRLYEWAWLELPLERGGAARSRGSWILIRRSLSDPSKRAYYRVSGPAGTTLSEAVRVAGRRWSIEAGLEEAKGEVGLEKSRSAWLSGLVSSHHTGLVGPRRAGRHAGAGKKTGQDDDKCIELSVPELRRLLHMLREPEDQRAKRLWWSRFRRVHQAVARRCHVARRARQLPLPRAAIPRPIRVLGLSNLTQALWERLQSLLPPQKPRTGRPAVDHRLIVEGILWKIQTGSSWRKLPERFGPWSTVASRYRLWRKEGRWTRMLLVLQASEELFLSSA